MGFPLEPKSVTLNDLEQHNDNYLALSRKIGIFGSHLCQIS